MTTAFTPAANTVSVVVAAQALLITNRVRGQLDLRLLWGANVTLAIARLSTTAYTNPIDVLIHRYHGTLAGSAGSLYSTSGGRSLYNRGRSSTLTASGTVTARVSTQNALADTTIVTKTSNAGFTAYNSLMAFTGATAPGSIANAAAVTTFEVARTSGFTGTGPWTHTLAGPLGIVHPVDDYITSAVDVFDLWLPGNAVYDITFDAYNIVAGAGAIVQALADVQPSDTGT